MNILLCNVIATTMMCHLVLPQMSAREKGAIINIGSISSIAPMPLMSVYCASKVATCFTYSRLQIFWSCNDGDFVQPHLKAFVDMFSQGLEMEYRSRNIIVQSVIPGYVATKMGKIREPSWTSPSPANFAKQAIRTVGIVKRTAVHTPHRLAVSSLRFNGQILCKVHASLELFHLSYGALSSPPSFSGIPCHTSWEASLRP